MNIEELKALFAQVDVCMMTTIGEQGVINSRPMLCNHTDELLSEMYFFCMKDSLKTKDIAHNANVSLIFQDKDLGFDANMMCQATLIDDVDSMAAHWDPKLEVWWSEKEHTPNLCMIRCQVHHIRYWHEGTHAEISF